MYWPDGYHPNKLASYLIACTMYATIYGKSPVGLPATVYLTPAARRRKQPYLEVDAKTARLLQSIAAESAREIRKSGATLKRSGTTSSVVLRSSGVRRPGAAPPSESAANSPTASLEGGTQGSH